MTVEELKKGLNELFSDTSVTAPQTRDRLIELRDEIEVMIDAINEDMPDIDC
jgi:hypothetical protein